MIRTSELEQVCSRLAQMPPCWEKLSRRIEKNSKLKEQPLSTRLFANVLSENHLDMCLEQIALDFWNEFHIHLDPIRSAVSQSYLFAYKEKRVYVYHRESNSPAAEYDKVALVNNLPVVFEIKIKKWRDNGGKKNKNALKAGVYNQKLAPIRELVGCDVGYVIVIPRDYYDYFVNDVWRSPTFDAFRRDNGLVVPFYTTRHKFQEEVEQLLIPK